MIFSPKTAVCLRPLISVRAEKTVHAIYFSQGPSQLDACMRLIEIHGLGIINLAKVSPDDQDEADLKQKYAAEDQMIIIFGADEKEIARFQRIANEDDFKKWIAEKGSKLLVANK